MEKIKFNYVRITYLCFTIIIFHKIIFQLIQPSSLRSNLNILIKEMLTVVFIYFFIVLYDKFKRGIFFIQDGVLVDIKKKQQINWEDLIVERNGFKPKLMSLRVIILKSKTNNEIKANLELNWFNEQSAISAIKRYAPKTSDLYKLIDEYLEKRKIDI